MKITVPDTMLDHFWEEPAEGAEEFWALRWPIKAQPGDRVIFHRDKTPIAEAIVSRVEKPGESSCSTTGKFKSMWKVFWRNDSFKPLRSA